MLGENANSKISRKWYGDKRYWHCNAADPGESSGFYMKWSDIAAETLAFNLCYQLPDGSDPAAVPLDLLLTGIDPSGEEIPLQYQVLDAGGKLLADMQTGQWYCISVTTQNADTVVLRLNDGDSLQDGVLILEDCRTSGELYEDSTYNPIMENAWIPIVVCSVFALVGIFILLVKHKQSQGR